jgi:hypothetical protein
VLNLDEYAGGLTPIKRGGGFQTKSLHFKAKNGKYYKFRSINKDPEKVLPEDFRRTFVADIVQDQISTSHPLSALVASPLLNAVGVLNAEPIIVLLPDDPKLGEYRNDFKNVLGTFAENPKDDTEEALIFAGADRVEKMYKIFEELEEDNDDQVDALEYLKARLMDILLGDWDRHVGQWKWARYKKSDKKIWIPIPRDRDQAFSLYDGVLPWMTAKAVPQIEGFGDDYPQINDLTWSGRHLDRRFLVAVEKPAWDSITVLIQTQLTDNVIENAVQRMPPEWFAKDGERMIYMLKARRDKLHLASAEYYALISKYVSIYASDKAEFAEINRMDDKQVAVRIYKKDKKAGGKKGLPFYHRVFQTDETKEIRIDLLAGDDTAIIRGEVDRSSLVRVIGGKGKDTLIDSSIVNGYFWSVTPFASAEKKTIFYDSGNKTKFIVGPSTKINTDKAPPIKSYNEDTDNYNEKYEPQTEDRGHDWKAGFWLGYNSDDGLTIGGGPILYEFGFRTKPYVYRMSLLAAYVTNLKAFLLEYNGEFYTLVKNFKVTLDARELTGYTNFYGFGNETKRDAQLDKADYYRFRPNIVKIASAFEYHLSQPAKIWAGLSYYHTDIQYERNLFLDNQELTNPDDESYLGINVGYQLDTRDQVAAPLKGIYIDFRSMNYPLLRKINKGFNKLLFDARGYVSTEFITTSTIAMRVNAEKIWGDFPIVESAYLGGVKNLRGYVRQRFSGDALLYAAMELRSYLFPLKVIIPGRFGFTAFGETGRVFYQDEDSKKWHPTYGGGIWGLFLHRTVIANITLARSAEDFIWYFSTKFMF